MGSCVSARMLRVGTSRTTTFFCVRTVCGNGAAGRGGSGSGFLTTIGGRELTWVAACAAGALDNTNAGETDSFAFATGLEGVGSGAGGTISTVPGLSGFSSFSVPFSTSGAGALVMAALVAVSAGSVFSTIASAGAGGAVASGLTVLTLSLAASGDAVPAVADDDEIF